MKAAYVVFDMNKEEYMGICPNYEDLSTFILNEARVDYATAHELATDEEIDAVLRDISNRLYDDVYGKKDLEAVTIETKDDAIAYAINLVPLMTARENI